MRINELKKIAEENEYKQLENKHNQLNHELEFRRNAGGLENIVNQITIRKGVENRIFFNINYCNEKDLNMIKASLEYAETPVKDREEEKRFYLKHRWLESVGNRYLIWDPGDNCYYLDDSAEYYSGKMKFTLNEIEEIKEKFDTDLADFDTLLVEVEDEKM